MDQASTFRLRPSERSLGLGNAGRPQPEAHLPTLQLKQGGRGWNVKVWPVEVGCHVPPQGLLRKLGIRGQAQRKAIKELATAAERSSHWLWLKRKGVACAAK